MELKSQQIASVQRALMRWHRVHGLQAPWRDTGDPYETMVAAVMAQQTQMSRVLPAFERFIGAFSTVEELAGASVADVIRAWAGMGYNRRAVRLHRAARQIAATGWPPDAASLARIEGVGPFTAAIIASFAFGQRAACVDTNVRRVLGRIFGREDASPRDMQELADVVLHRREPARWNQALMDYGAVVCTPRPKCAACIVAGMCVSREEYEAPGRIVADKRPAYRMPRPRFQESDRHARGRIIDALRALTPGRSMSVRRIAATTGIDEPRVSALAGALAQEGLLKLVRGRAALPE